MHTKHYKFHLIIVRRVARASSCVNQLPGLDAHTSHTLDDGDDDEMLAQTSARPNDMGCRFTIITSNA